MDARQVVSVNSAEGGERYLSPLAQLVGAESAISQRREMIRRWQREVSQKEILARTSRAADSLIDRRDRRPQAAGGVAYVWRRRRSPMQQAAMEWNKEVGLARQCARSTILR